MQTSAPPGKPTPTHTQLDDATNLDTAFNAHFDNEVAEEPVKEVALAAPERAPEPVAEVPTPAPVDEPIVIPEPVQRQIAEIASVNYRREFVEPLERQYEDLVHGIGKYIDLGEGVDNERQFVQPLLREYGVDKPGFNDVTEEYIEDRITEMDCSNIQKEKQRLNAKDFFAAKQRRQEADQNQWKETYRRGLEQRELSARRDAHLVNTIVREPEFSELRQLQDLAVVGDPFAKNELEKINAFCLPRVQGYLTQGLRETDAIRASWRDLLKQRKITLGPGKELQKAPAAPKKEVPPGKPKAKPGESVEERLFGRLTDSFEQNLAKDAAPMYRGYYK